MIHCRIPKIAIPFACLLLGGCVSQTTAPQNPDSNALADSQSASHQDHQDAPLSKETLYALLVAEVAGHRNRLDISLGNYLEQAHATGDPGIAERALRIAHYIGARQAALEASRLWATADPENVQALQAYALEVAQAGHLNDAAKLMQHILQLGGTSHFDLLALRADDIPPHERTTLQATIQDALTEFPTNPQLMLAQAIMLEHDENYSGALQQLDQLIDQHPEYEQGLLHQGRLLHRLQRDEEAADHLQAAIERHPHNRRMHLLYAQILIDLDRLDEALDQFKLLHEQSPNDSDLTLSIALTSLEGNLLDEAELYLNKLLLLGERDSTAHYYLGRLAEMRDDWQKAQNHYLQASDDADLLAAYTQLTRMLADHEQWPQARIYLQQARENHPSKRIQLFMLESEVLTEQREYDQAHDVLSEAIALYPRNISLLYTRAMLAEKNDHLEQLEQDLRIIIKIDPNNSVALNALGYTLADRTDRYQEAAELIRQALLITPDDPAVIDSLGWVEFRLGNTSESLRLLQKAYQLYPDSEIAAHLVEVLWFMQRQDEALEIWEQALERSPDNDLLKAVMERLNPS